MIAFADEPGIKLEAIVQQVARTVTQAKEKWLKEACALHCPDFILMWGDSTDMHQKRRAAKWLNKKQYALQEKPDGRCRLMRGPKVLAEFRTIIKDGKVTFEQIIHPL